MTSRTQYLLYTIAAFVCASACFVFAHISDVAPMTFAFFTVGALLVTAFFVALGLFFDLQIKKNAPKAYFSVFMVVVSATFSLLYYFSPEITGYDVKGDDLISIGVMFLLTFICVVLCSVMLFRRLREYADPFYTACFTVGFTTVSALFYLFGDILPESEILDALKLFAVVSSLSLALSLFMIERYKRIRNKIQR